FTVPIPTNPIRVHPPSSCRSRRTPDDRGLDHDDSDNDGPAPPMTKKRAQHENGSHRRRSSPDCLDTTTPDHEPSAGGARHAKPPLEAARPRTATRRTRRPSASSVDTVASAIQLTTPGSARVNANGANPRDRPDRNTPSVADHLRDLRESPDPLDTISPAPPSAAVRSRLGASAVSANPEDKPIISPTLSRTARRRDPEPKTETETIGTVNAENNESTTAQSTDTHSADVLRSQRKRKSDPVETEPPELKPEGTERRSLRSTDTGSRCKSELANYFYNYEQLISLEGPKPESLTATTTVSLLNDLSEPLPTPSTLDTTPFGNPLQKLWDCEVITLSETVSDTRGDDPLSDELYFRAHRKFERQEKQLRNIERDRAQHEKQQVERLLDELRGQDWLRVMGLHAVHDSDKKLYEPKRQILMQELLALVNKFQVWKDEERRRKLAKDKPIPAVDRESSRKRSRPVEDTEEAESSPAPGTETLRTPDPNDVDAWAARQLHQEARSASAAKRRKSISGARKLNTTAEDGASHSNANKGGGKRQQTLNFPVLSAPTHHVPIHHLPPPPDKPFTSFFAEPHHRELAIAALTGNHRGRSHTILAFGHPIPDMDDREFQPPAELLTDEAIRASQRQRRRLKRRSQG
ncbi:uncharacterized protein N7459_002225, partial [Penicillium hispanicum]|uniref:uncharacterized protein n=1 Tax=Penicillium hispanicum TaxID=1080232 RepID=UPI00253F7353